MTAGEWVIAVSAGSANRGMEAERRRQYRGIQELIRALDQEKRWEKQKAAFAGIAQQGFTSDPDTGGCRGQGILSGQAEGGGSWSWREYDGDHRALSRIRIAK